MSRGIKETAVSFFKRGGHSHDGKNSTKIDFSSYTSSDIKILAKLLNDPDVAEGGATSDAADVIESGGVGTQVADTFVQDKIDPPKSLVLATDKVMYGHERTYIDAEWEAPPVRDFYYDEYYFNYYYPHDFGYSVKEYAVAIVKEGIPDSDHRTITKNTKIRFWDVDPGIDYRLYVWAINPLGNESLYITDTIVSKEINRTLVAEKNRSILDNGGFESGIGNWTKSGVGTLSIENTIVYEGSNSLKVTVGGGGGGTTLITEPIPVVQELSYDISYWTQNTAAASTDSIYVYWYDENNDEVGFDHLGTYDNLLPGGASADEFNRLPRNKPFLKAPLTSVTAQLFIELTSSAAEDFYIDDVRFEETSTIEGAVFRTDSDDQAPRIEIDDHYNIRGPRTRSLAEFGPRITFDETFTDKNLGHQESMILSSGIPVVDDPALYTGHEVGEGRLILLSSPSDPTGVDGQGRMELRYHEVYDVENDAFEKIHSLPLGVIAYAETASTISTTAGGAEVILTGAADVICYSDRVYRWTMNSGHLLYSNVNSFFEVKFQLNAVNRLTQQITSQAALASGYPLFGGTWSPSADVSGVARVLIQRVAGTGTVDVVPDPRTYFSLEDIGSVYIHDLNP